MEIQEKTHSLRDYINILKRRKLQMLLTFLGLMALSLLIAFGLPPEYRSTATILLEDQEVSEDVGRNQSATEYADARVYKVQQRALTSINLSKIIDKFDLYEDKIRRVPRSELIDDMREDISQELVSADVIDPRSGRPTRVTIAFDLGFDHRNPVTAQKVASELVDLYRSENIEQGTGAAEKNTEFFKDQVEVVNREVLDLEDKLARFKAENEGALPEFIPLMMQLMQKTEKDVDAAQRQFSALEERRIFLESSLLQTDPYSGGAAGPILTANEEIELAKSQLRQAKALYGPNHPDVRRLETQLARLTGGLGASDGDIAGVEQQIRETEAALRDARKNYGPQHPEVVRLERVLSGLVADRDAAMAQNNAGVQMVTTNSRVSEKVNVRSQASADSSVIATMYKGQQATLVSEEGDWYRISLADGSEGFVNTGWTEVVTGNPQAAGATGNQMPTNPAYIQIQANLASVITQMRSMQGQIGALRESLGEYTDKLNKAPMVEREYSQIMRDLTDRRTSLQNYKQEYEEAVFNENVILGQRGQRFTLIEPPIAASTPHSPNRIALLFLGMVLSLFGTFAAAVIAESLDNAVRSASDVADISGAAPLASIPVIETRADAAKSKRNMVLWSAGVVAGGVLFLTILHFAYKPLDVVWFKILQQLGL